MPRPKDSRESRRVQLRLESDVVKRYDGYSTEELNEIFTQALRTITPKHQPQHERLLVRSEKTVTSSIVRLKVEDRTVSLVFPEKRDDFNDLVKKHHNYAWKDGCWQRTFKKDFLVRDRAAEMCNALLLAGFCVQVEQPVIERVVSDGYETEAHRIIDKSKHSIYSDWVVVQWRRYEDFYSNAMSLSCAKYADGAVRIPSEQFLEIEDFAETHGFTITHDAKELLNRAKAQWEAAVIVSPRKKRTSTKKAENPVDNVEVIIPDSLIDEDA